MKCVIDLDLLNPPPIPSARHFNEMHLHQRKLAQYKVKIALSHKLQSLIWEHWRQVDPLQYQKLLGNICRRHFAPDFPNDFAVETDQVHLSPPFLSGESEWDAPWLTSLMACYLDERFNTGGAFLATWSHPEFIDRKAVQVTYPDLAEKLPLVRDETEWDELLAVLREWRIGSRYHTRTWGADWR